MAYLRRLNLWFGAVAFAILVAALAAPSVVAVRIFERELLPEVGEKALTLGRSLTALFGRATSQGIALSELIGVEDLFAQVQRQHSEFDLLALSDANGRVLFRRGGPNQAVGAPLGTTPGADPEPAMRRLGEYHVLTLPLADSDGARVWLHIGSHRGFVQRLLRETLLDIAVVLVVALFIAIELLHFVAGGTIARHLSDLARAIERGRRGDFSGLCEASTLASLGPVPAGLNRLFAGLSAAYAELLAALGRALRARNGAARATLRSATHALRSVRRRYVFVDREGVRGRGDPLVKLRAPLFLFLIAEDLSRSFIPIYAGALYAPLPGVSAQLALGLPIMLFMLIVALMQPLAGSYSERIGRRNTLLLGIAIGVAAHLATAFAQSLHDLLLWRALAGAGWALVFVAGQGYVLDNTDASSRSQGLAYFVGVIMVASICGPSIGGILADGIGYRATLVLGAALAAASAWLVWRGVPRDAGRRPATPTLRWADVAALAASRRFVVLCVAAAVPAKIVLIGFCFYLVPLYVVELGSTAAMAGRLIMLYSIIMVLGVPIAAKLSDRFANRSGFVAAGLVLSAIAGVLPLAAPGVAGVAAAVLVLGVAQAFSIAPQSAMIGEVCAPEIAALGEGAVYGVYRLVERIGNALGPVIAALLVQRFGYGEAFGAIGALALLGAAWFAATFMLGGNSSAAPLAHAGRNGRMGGRR